MNKKRVWQAKKSPLNFVFSLLSKKNDVEQQNPRTTIIASTQD